MTDPYRATRQLERFLDPDTLSKPRQNAFQEDPSKGELVAIIHYDWATQTVRYERVHDSAAGAQA